VEDGALRSRSAALASALAIAAGVAAACAPPPRGACDPTPRPGVLGTICGFDHPEDLEPVPGAGVVLASGLRPGAGLWALESAAVGRSDASPFRIWPGPPDAASETGSAPAGEPGCRTPPRAASVHLHGLGARADPAGTVRVAAVGHGDREAVELFDLAGSGRDAVAHWRGCVRLPPGLLGNDVAVAPDGELVVTNFVPRREGVALRLELARAALGFETGEVLAWRRDAGWRSLPGTRAAGPNGVTLSPDGERVYFAENGRGRVVRVTRRGAGAGGASFSDVRFHVDNVRWVDGDRLLAIVHTGGVGAVLERCLLDWALVEVDPDSLAARELLRHDGRVLCGATSAVRVGEHVLIGSMSEERIGLWRAP
jgi:hypothetical protein